MYSKIIKNGQIIDGTGKPMFTGDVAIESDRIVQVGDLGNARAQEIIDATGKYVAPGFIDIQNHSDVYWTIFDSPSLDSLVAQGITTALIGNCGASLAPLLSRDSLLPVQKWHDLAGVNLNWQSFGEYMQELSRHRFGVNIASLVGYSTIRRGLVKDAVRALKDNEMKVVKKLLKESFEAGAFGLSSGLAYTHESFVGEEEYLQLAETVKDSDALLAVHLRSEGAEIVDAVSQVLLAVDKYGVNLKISHLKARDKNNWHFLPEALGLIEQAYQKKGQVHFDVYPYDFVWHVLYQYLPKWAHEGGREIMLHHLKDPVQRKKILDYLHSRDVDYSQIFIAATSLPLNVAGKSLGEIASRQNISSTEALLAVLENGGSKILAFDRNLDQRQVEYLLAHGLSMVATDGAGFPAKTEQLVHPRCFGSMPKFLALVREKGFCSIEKAVQKITSMSAEKIGLDHRGKLAVDYYADVVVFSENVASEANYKNPTQLPSGIEHVLVNGQSAFIKGEFNAKLSGKILKR